MSNFDIDEVNEFIAKFKIKKSKIKPNVQTSSQNTQNENPKPNENLNNIFNTPNIPQTSFNQPYQQKEVIKPKIQQPVFQTETNTNEIFGESNDNNDDIFGGDNSEQVNNGITNQHLNQNSNDNNINFNVNADVNSNNNNGLFQQEKKIENNQNTQAFFQEENENIYNEDDAIINNPLDNTEKENNGLSTNQNKNTNEVINNSNKIMNDNPFGDDNADDVFGYTNDNEEDDLFGGNTNKVIPPQKKILSPSKIQNTQKNNDNTNLKKTQEKKEKEVSPFKFKPKPPVQNVSLKENPINMIKNNNKNNKDNINFNGSPNNTQSPFQNNENQTYQFNNNLNKLNQNNQNQLNKNNNYNQNNQFKNNNTTSNNGNNNNKDINLQNIYKNFSNELKPKINVFESDDLNKEIEKLDDSPTNETKDIFNNKQLNSVSNGKSSSGFLSERNEILNSNYLTFSSFINDNIVTVLSNSISFISKNNLLNEYQNNLKNSYFPESYSNIKEYSKYINYLNIIVHNNPNIDIISYIAVSLENDLLKRNFTTSIAAFNDLDFKNDILNILKQNLQDKGKGSVPLTDLINFDKINSNETLNILSGGDMNSFIYDLFKKGVLYQNNYFYIYFLLNVLSTGSSIPNYDDLFDNFEYTLLILLEKIPQNSVKIILENLLNCYSPKMNFLHYIILTFIQGDFKIKDSKFYGLLLTSFLNNCTIEKIIVADVLNFIFYTLMEKFPNVVAKSSILIKLKYVLLRQFDNDNNVNYLGSKVNENISQIGEISHNKYFRNYLNQKYKSQPQTQSTESNQNNKKNLSNTENNQQESKSGGFSLDWIWGRGQEEKKEERKLTEEEINKLSDKDRFHYLHPGEPDYYYDPQIKRYVIYGKIYDDQEEVIIKKNKEKPMVPPPKIKMSPLPNTTQTQQVFNNDNNNLNSFNNNNVAQKVSNPFGQKRVPPKVVQNPNKSKQNLTKRYAVGYDK